ncbi:DsbE family thiol:disulfide interchange protein [Methylobrevis pamukkalensis]|uniref:Thiol:disulfide interchange protein CycY n=1 Tax=Methylobrevis pamukkalensis TaxID=1439726 RepID=A0A1E3H856_9HYPH|nr:DsbE family thiol:disulfide interchange protein [Methylobrevis pamukkalensis]ODN72518.1 Thiol:disulfide interchange protein CycY precursor [Methylobrevis pamukkalensis]
MSGSEPPKTSETAGPAETGTTGPARRRGPGVVVFLPLVLFLALSAVFLHQLFSGDPSEIPSALIGRKVPAFDLPPVEGLTRNGAPVPGLSTGDLVAAPEGKVTLVNVWGSWCVPCRDEHPLLMELAKRDDIRLVGIDYKDEPGNAVDFLAGLGNPFAAVGSDRTGRTGIDFGVYGVPETFVVDAAGNIRFKFIGPLSPEGITGRLDPEIEKAKVPLAVPAAGPGTAPAAGS